MSYPQQVPDLPDHAGAVHLGECRAAGMTDEKTGWLVTSGRWQSPFPRVFVTFSGPIPRETLEEAALLYAGKGAAISHGSSGTHWGLCRMPDDIDVTVPYPRQVDPQPGLVIHRSRNVTEDEIHPALSPRRTRIERTVIDMLASKRNADGAIGLAADAIRGRATTASRLREALARHPKTRWRAVLMEALPDIAAGAHSALEVREAKGRKRHGLPLGERQFKRLADGSEYLDVIDREYRMHTELDGRLGHDRARESWRDMRRDNRSEIARLRHLRYGWADLFDRPCDVAIEEAVILRQQGWRGRFKRCRNCPRDLPADL